MNHSPSAHLWKIGELAEHAGVSVRTLHYYEEIGLLVPSHRTESNHRLYTEKDVAKLLQISSLKEFGMPLDQIKQLIESPTFSPVMTLQMQVKRIEDMMKNQMDLIDRLKGLLRFMEQQKDPSGESFLETLRVMRKVESYYTQEELQELKERGAAFGEENMRSVEAEWPRLIATMQEKMEAGVDVSDPEVQKMTKRWMELVDMFTGGNLEIAAKLKKMYDENPEMAQQFGGATKELREYVEKARTGL